MSACRHCLRRTALIAALAGVIEIEWRKRHGRTPRVLAMSDADLLGLAKDEDIERRYEHFDAAGAHERLAHARLEVSCRCAGERAEQLRLCELEDPPAVLHMTDASVLQSVASQPAVAVVGARRASSYGLGVARMLGQGLAQAGVPVISGMAMGIDSAAHQGALDAGGTTVAVLAGGADIPYPARGRTLYEGIRATGAVVSELPPGFRARRWSFPARNRIIAALATTVVVVEGAERSGSLITADFASQLGRGVTAVPGLVTSRLAGGVNALIRAGAAPVRGVQDVLDEALGVGVLELAQVDPAERLDPELRGLLDRIEEGGTNLAALVRRPQETSAVVRGLAELERQGVVRRDFGGAYVRVPPS